MSDGPEQILAQASFYISQFLKGYLAGLTVCSETWVLFHRGDELCF